MRNLLGGIVIIALLLAGSYYLSLGPGQDITLSSSNTSSKNGQQVSTVNARPSTSIKSQRVALVEAYRIKPDHRLILAVAEVHHFLSGEAKEKATVAFLDGSWRVRYRNVEVGSIPEYPDFSHFMVLLTSWAKLLQQQHPLTLSLGKTDPIKSKIDKQLNHFLVSDVADALRQIDLAWNSGVRDAALLRSATRALVFLTVQSMDRTEIADLVPGKALALLVLTKSLTNFDMAHEETLLAQAMGYSTHATRVGLTLPEDDAARLYVTSDDQRLLQFAGSKKGTVESRYLWLMRLAQLEQEKSMVSWINAYFPDDWVTLPIFKAHLELHDAFESREILSELLPRVVLLTLAQEVGLPKLSVLIKNIRSKTYSDKELNALLESVQAILAIQTATLVDNFDSGLDILEQKYKGPFLDVQTTRTFYQGYLYSGLYILGLHYLDSLSSVDAVAQFATTLGQSPKGIAAEFARWYHALAQAKVGNVNVARSQQELIALPNIGLGLPPLLRGFEAYKPSIPYGDPALFTAIKSLTPRMDTRVQHRFILGGLAFSELNDLRLAEQLYRSVLEVAPARYPQLQIWFADYTGNQKVLQELLHDPHLVPEDRVAILGHLEKLDALNPEALRKEYSQVIGSAPDNWHIRSKYVEYLERIKDYSEARSIIAGWLSSNDESTGLHYVFAHSAMARTYYAEGRYQEGWDAIEPVIESQQAGALERAAMLLYKLGQANDAEKMAMFALNRYPDSLRTRTLVAEILWRHSNYVDAAKVIKASPYPIDADGWRFTIGERFVEAFRDLPNEEALKAFAALAGSGINSGDLQYLPVAVTKIGNNELAFRMASQLHLQGMQQLELLIDAYGYLKSWKGKPLALNWLRMQLPLGMLNPASMVLFSHKHYDLLWDLIDNPERGDYPELVWLIRAAASAKLGQGNDPHRQALMDYYGHTTRPWYNATSSYLWNVLQHGFKFETPEDNESVRYYHTLGRYILGLVPEEQITALAVDGKKVCEIAFYVGVGAQGAGRYGDASDWFHVVVETGLRNEGEFHWAHDTLTLWQRKGMSLSRLAAEKL